MVCIRGASRSKRKVSKDIAVVFLGSFPESVQTATRGVDLRERKEVLFEELKEE
jgi:hypothetical protein